MDKKYTISGSLLGVVLLITVFSTLYTSDYKQILNDNPNYDLILLEYQKDKIELLSRVNHPMYEYFRWKYQDAKTTLYFENDKVATSYWQIFKGTKGIWYNTKGDLFYYYDNNSVFLAQNIDYFFDSRHKNKAGTLLKTIEIYPRKNKETIKWIPFTEDSFCLRWIAETDEFLTSDKYGKERFQALLKKYVKVDWADSQDLVSYAYKYKNGKIRVGYTCQKGEQLIDPSLGDYLPEGVVNVFLDGENFSKNYEYEEIVNISAIGNVSGLEMICINFSAPGYGDNYSCNYINTSFLYTAIPTINTFSNDLEEINLTFETFQNSTNITYPQNAIVNYFNISLTGYSK